MRSLPDQVLGLPGVRPQSVARAVSPYLGFATQGIGSRRVEDAALLVLAAVYADRGGPVLEALLSERMSFDRLMYAVNRCPVHRGGA
ncbi:MAG: hypothetical protein WCK58_03840 [Chloroflexota bacterium]